MPTSRKVGEILLVEHHPPVYTFGLRQKDYALHAARLRDLGAEVHKVGNVLSISDFSSSHTQVRRGGLATYHGPGQLVCYPILNLRALRVSQQNSSKHYLPTDTLSQHILYTLGWSEGLCALS